MQVKTIRIKSTHPPTQGDFVEINESDFDPALHQLFDVAAEPIDEKAPDKKAKKAPQ